jgi:hypothetical protein
MKARYVQVTKVLQHLRISVTPQAPAMGLDLGAPRCDWRRLLSLLPYPYWQCSLENTLSSMRPCRQSESGWTPGFRAGRLATTIATLALEGRQIRRRKRNRVVRSRPG